MPDTKDTLSSRDRILSRRVRREQRTLTLMIGMYCEAHHPEPWSDPLGSSPGPRAESALCQECAPLLDYAMRRIDNCRFGDRKPTCAQCTVHCFRPEMRERIRAVMRYSGPRMTLRHPYLAVRHLLDSKGSSRGP